MANDDMTRKIVAWFYYLLSIANKKHISLMVINMVDANVGLVFGFRTDVSVSVSAFA